MTSKLNVFVRLAEELATLTTCAKRRVGCVIVSKDYMEVLGIGFNGQACDEGDCPGGDPCGCLHAEANALIKMRYPSPPAMLIVTCPPCLNCAGLILNKAYIDVVVVTNLHTASYAGIERLLKQDVLCYEHSSYLGGTLTQLSSKHQERIP